MYGNALDKDNRISACQSAKEIWDYLRTAHEGTCHVKESKMDMLTTQYEAFTMNRSDSIQKIHTRFIVITNEMHFLGEVILTSKKVRKILRVISKS